MILFIFIGLERISKKKQMDNKGYALRDRQMGLVSEDISGWKLCKISNGSLSCENSKLNENDISKVKETVQSKFGERMKKESVFVSYDNWSGIYLMAIPGKTTRKSDKLVKDIYEYLIEAWDRLVLTTRY